MMQGQGSGSRRCDAEQAQKFTGIISFICRSIYDIDEELSYEQIKS